MNTEDKMIKIDHAGFDTETSINKSEQLLNISVKRRTVREISDKEVPKEVIDNLAKIFGSAPSGANKQPWFLCIVRSSEMKQKIREYCEKTEKENYERRFSGEMKADLKKLNTNHNKPFLRNAPYLIVIFRKKYNLEDDGSKSKNYYTNESVGIATGMLIAAINYCGLVTIPYTPSPMGFLNDLLARPENETPYMLLPVGYPEDEAMVPYLTKKDMNEFVKYY